MSEKLNGTRAGAWSFFKSLVIMTLITRKIVSTHQEASEFAESLDMSFDELYENEPRSRWAQVINRDCDDYQKDLERMKSGK